jgi:methyl-accepting chemotaxis protein
MKFRRHRYLIDAVFQSKVILTFIAVSFLGSLVAVTLFNYITLKKLDVLMQSSHISVQSTGEIISPVFVQVSIVAFVFVAALMIITAMMIIRRVAKPLYNMSVDIKNAAHGDLTVEPSLKQKGEFRDTAVDLDLMLKSIRQKFKSINMKYMNISRSIESLCTEDTEKITLDKLLADIEVFKAELNTFRTENTEESTSGKLPPDIEILREALNTFKVH